MISTKNLGIDFDVIDEEKQEDVADEMLVRDAVVALAVDPKFLETSYLIKITEEKEKTWRMVSATLSRKGWPIFKGYYYKGSLILTISTQNLRHPSLYFPLEKVWYSRQCSWNQKRDI